MPDRAREPPLFRAADAFKAVHPIAGQPRADFDKDEFEFQFALRPLRARALKDEINLTASNPVVAREKPTSEPLEKPLFRATFDGEAKFK
jgi:hypothetical protein